MRDDAVDGREADGAPVRSRRGAAGRRRSVAVEPTPAAHDRFLRLDRERAEREWRRYEGTPQRELFRELRERFLQRHAQEGRWALDVGSGPGRFLPWLGGPRTGRVALDLSWEMLAAGRDLAPQDRRSPAGSDSRVRGDAVRPPLREQAFAEVALVGNTLGFEAGAGDALLRAVEALLSPGGVLVLEIAPGPGERSRYLGRLPASAVRRLLAAPPAAVRPRLLREGFVREAERHRPRSFRRWSPSELLERWRARGWSIDEVMAVAPALGPDQTRLREVARDRRAWQRLLELEEQLGREPSRWSAAAAVLVAARSPVVKPNDFERGETSIPG